MRQRLSPLDVATGTMIGCAPRAQPLIDLGITPRAALEAELMPALLRAPCLVSFSGGRDSSAVLAAATALARREGLGLPIPVTNVFARAAGSDETDWQQRVISHLGLDDWVRISHDRELDIVGPYAQRLMRRHGLVLPCNAHFHLPLLDAAQGGSLLTGIGGDELFTASCRLRPAMTGSARRLPRDLARLAISRGPTSFRSAVMRRRQPCSLPWLTQRAERELTASLAAVAACQPRELAARLAWWRRLRYLGDGKLGLTWAAQDAEVLLIHPLLGEPLWAAVARTAMPYGFASRAAAMRRLFGDLLPGEILDRTSKAHFDEALWTATAREFVDGWSGDGVPAQYVDRDALHRQWRDGRPHAQSFTLLQAAWLVDSANSFQERADGTLV